MEATLPIIRELTAAGDSLMWIVGPGDMVSENTSRGIREPQVRRGRKSPSRPTTGAFTWTPGW